jgi:hypothetical protein
MVQLQVVADEGTEIEQNGVNVRWFTLQRVAKVGYKPGYKSFTWRWVV